MGVFKRGNVWWIRFQIDGKEIRRSAYTDNKSVAIEYAQQVRTELNRVRRANAIKSIRRQSRESG